MLVLARLAESRSEDGQFRVVSVGALFHELRLPSPGNTSNVVLSLEKKGLVRRGGSRGLWRLTHTGIARSEEALSGIDLAALAAEAAVVGTRLGGAPHLTLPPELGAPPSLIPVVRDFLEKHPFDRNVFGMTRFPDDESEEPPDPVRAALEIARSACAKHQLEFHLASDRSIEDDLWLNVAGHMWSSRYGIAFFEDVAEPKRRLNYNLTIEVGAMLMTGRRCALLKDDSIERLPTNLVGRIYKPVDLKKPETVEKALHTWMRDDLDLGVCDDCK